MATLWYHAHEVLVHETNREHHTYSAIPVPEQLLACITPSTWITTGTLDHQSYNKIPASYTPLHIHCLQVVNTWKFQKKESTGNMSGHLTRRIQHTWTISPMCRAQLVGLLTTLACMAWKESNSLWVTACVACVASHPHRMLSDAPATFKRRCRFPKHHAPFSIPQRAVVHRDRYRRPWYFLCDLHPMHPLGNWGFTPPSTHPPSLHLPHSQRANRQSHAGKSKRKDSGTLHAAPYLGHARPKRLQRSFPNRVWVRTNGLPHYQRPLHAGPSTHLTQRCPTSATQGATTRALPHVRSIPRDTRQRT